MTAYTLRFDHLDRAPHVAPRPVAGHTTTDLAQAVHRHARGILGSRRVDIHLDPATLTGTVLQAGAPIGSFTLTATETPTTTEPPSEALHGYTLHDIQRLTRLALHLDRWYTAGDMEERYDAVWFAIVEALLAADTQPSRSSLLRAGMEASDVLVRDEMRTHGRCTLNIGQPMPRFHAYWNPSNTPSPEPRIIDREALAQIWPQLQPRQQQALEALAATGDYDKAAAALGVTRGTFTVLISTGRRRFYSWWHEHETPSRQWRTDRRVSSRAGRDHLGRERLTAAQVDAYRERRHAGEPVKVLAAEADITPTALYRLLKGQYKGAEATA
jgi:hypothetical protein